MNAITRPGQITALAPLVGAVLALALLIIATAESAQGTASLIGLGGLVIVVGGVTTTAFMSFHHDDVCQALRGIGGMLMGGTATAVSDELRQDVETIVRWARLGYEAGPRGLERGMPRGGIGDPLLRYGLNLVVSEYAEPDVRVMMKTAADSHYERRCVPVDVLRSMSSHAPAFGMIGTLLGMVAMLHNLADQPQAIGASLAIAFLCTLYGVLSARMITMPAAAWLEQQVERRRLRGSLIAEGMALLACRKPPTFIRDRLIGFLQQDANDCFSVIDGPADTRRLSDERTPPLLPLLRVIKG